MTAAAHLIAASTVTAPSVQFIYETDGSLNIYMASKLPEGVPASNWLPSPEGKGFNLNHRLYGPKKEVLSGEWYVPSIVKLTT